MTKLASFYVGALTVALTGCDCGTRTSRLVPKIEVQDELGNARTAVDFGQVQLKLTATKKVRIHNGGTAPLSVEKIDFSKALFAMAATPLPLSIRVGEDFDLPVTFTPTVADQRETGTVTLSSNDPATATVQLSLAGTGVTATAVVQPTLLDFGEVYVGEMKELNFTLTNSGSNELPVTSAKLSAATDPSVAADLAPLVKTLAAGESVKVTLRFVPTAPTALVGALEIVLPDGVGNKTIPIQGQGIGAVPKLCFKFDQTAFEQCTDGLSSTNLDIRFGSLCDARVYPADGGFTCVLDGGALPYERTGRMYVRNEGNTPVSYSLSIVAGQPSRCDGGASIDFHYADAPLSADGGALAMWNLATVKLPLTATDAKPWEAPSIAITYRARSVCRADDSDLSIVNWNRQGEPGGTTRKPDRMVATLTGSSALSNPVPSGGVSFEGNSPKPQDVSLVANNGAGPVRLLGVGLWQSADGGLIPDVSCSTAVAGPCIYFGWASSVTFPVTLEGTTGAGTSRVLGKIAYGILDGGDYFPPAQPQKVFAIVETSDPYTPSVTVPITGRP